jgi:DNA-binding beta-propeller fold protein YncE
MHRVPLFAVALSVATSGSGAAATMTHAVQPASRERGWMARKPNTKHAWLYAAGYNDSRVEIYDLEELGTPQIGTIVDGVSGPADVYLDPAGNLYVVNEMGSVSIYEPGQTSPAMTLSQDLTAPQGVTTDAAGNVYVANRDPHEIVVYPPGSTTVSHLITSPLFTGLADMFFDQSGTLYMADNWSGVLVLLPGPSQQVTQLGLQGIPEVGGVAMDARGDLFVANLLTKDYVDVFVPGQTEPARQLHTTADANFMASGYVHGKDYVFVPDYFGNIVSIFEERGRRPLSILQTGVSGLNGVVVKPAGMR